MKQITFVAPCFNEVENVGILYERIVKAFEGLPGYTFDIIFSDNASTDGTVDVLRKIAANDPRVKVIVNMRNFGPWRSPLHAMHQAEGDGVIVISTDLQDPPEMVAQFVEKWAAGYKIVLAEKMKTADSLIMGNLRKTYYWLLDKIAESPQLRNATGYGLFDREVIKLILSTGDHFFYMRGLIAETGYEVALVPYNRPARQHGTTKNSVYDLYVQAMNGITAESKLPLRLSALLGFFMSCFSLLVAVIYFGYKLLFWDSFAVGQAPLVIGIFFIGSVQLFFLGVIGEYIGAIHSRIFQRWIVVERERINFAAPHHLPENFTPYSAVKKGDVGAPHDNGHLVAK